MARATYTHSCGHEGVVIARNRREAASLAAYRERQKDVCTDCWREQQAEAARKAAEDAAACGLPTLRGTEKAVAWAETLRQSALATAGALADLAAAALEVGPTTVEDPEAFVVQHRTAALHDWTSRQILDTLAEILDRVDSPQALLDLLEALRRQDRAGWWIDHRAMPLPHLIRPLAATVEAIRAERRDAAEAADPVAAAAKEEAILRPAGEPVSPLVADLRVSGTMIDAVLPARDERFVSVMLRLDFAWSDRRWRRGLGVPVGTASDRLAEVAQQLLAAGFLVRLADDEAREKALAGDFQREPTRVVSLAPDGDLLKIAWRKPDDLHGAAKSLPGARYRDRAVWVPAGGVEAVTEFAETYGFCMTEAVTQLLAQHRAAVEAGAVVTSLRQGLEPVVGAAPATPAPLPVPQDCAVDPSLLD